MERKKIKVLIIVQEHLFRLIDGSTEHYNIHKVIEHGR